MSMPLTLNERALRLADYMAANAATLRIAVEVTGSGMRVLDCGIQSPGGLQAGLGLARVCLAGLGDVGHARSTHERLFVPPTGRSAAGSDPRSLP